MTTITDEQVRAAIVTYWDAYRNYWRPHGVMTPALDRPFAELNPIFQKPFFAFMSAALEAAERVRLMPRLHIIETGPVYYDSTFDDSDRERYRVSPIPLPVPPAKGDE